jgi:outer membrane protein W
MTALAAVMATASIDAVATGPQRGQGMQRPRPAGVVTRETTRTRTDNGFTSHTTATNSQGQTATRDVVHTRTDNGSVTSSTITTPNGNTLERTVKRTCDKAAKSCTTTVERERH